ncbi:sigma-70 family RNA polymerase sigma factor [Sorangium sp. So ce117]|uniref:sigma-70 family RNA polymerase sigma factor n=1 Tax=Sorangium sp. So ce117 TaxID=3133277 RepID=UPI003F63649C
MIAASTGPAPAPAHEAPPAHVAAPPAPMAAPGSDEELVARIAGGDREALAALYDRYAPALLALAQRVLGSPAEAEDLVHDCCLEVWRKAHTYEPLRGSARTWLTMRLRSRALDRLRSARQLRLVADGEENDAPAELGGPDPALGSDCARVRRVVAALQEDQRTVLELAYFEGLSLVEIGERLAVPVGTVKSRLSRALDKLRATLQEPPRAAAG